MPSKQGPLRYAVKYRSQGLFWNSADREWVRPEFATWYETKDEAIEAAQEDAALSPGDDWSIHEEARP